MKSARADAWRLAAFLVLAVGPPSVQADDGVSVVAVHLHSTVSTGALPAADIPPLAQAAGVDAVILTDSLVRRWEYGVWPARQLLKWTVEQPSVRTFGVGRYFEDVARAGQGASALVLPGVEAAPYYRWARPPWDRRGGQIREWQQHLLAFGLDEPADVERLPMAPTGYGPSSGPRPYQDFIDAVRSAGGLVFWAHPETGHAGRHGRIEDYTEAYPHLLEQTTGYHGFAITYLDKLSFVEPGGVWDRVLLRYVRGFRPEPAWILGELDWRGPHERSLDKMVTMVQAPADPAAILAAMRQGRMWAVFRHGALPAPRLANFEVAQPSTGAAAGIGGRLASDGLVEIRLDASVTPGAAPAVVRIIRNGEVFRIEELDGGPVGLRWADTVPAGARVYYRAILQDAGGLLYTNPVFVQREA